MKAKNFKQAIDALVILYKKGMRVKSMQQIDALGIDGGICYASKFELGYYMGRQFHKYKPEDVGSYWFPSPRFLYGICGADLKEIKRRSIKPRLTILLKIQADLNKRK